MKNIHLVLIGIIVIAGSGIPALMFRTRSRSGQGLGALLFSIGGILGLVGSVRALFSGVEESIRFSWLLPWGEFYIRLDALSAFFLTILFFVPMIAALFGVSYWPHDQHRGNSKRLGIFYGLLSAGMAMVVISRDAILLLVMWEIMAISAFFCSAVEDEKADVRKAGWIYLVATHVGTMLLLPLFVVWNTATGSFALDRAVSLSSGTANAIFILAFLGFGFKAGFMPLHVWLPGAHGNAPSHVSAVMSGVMLKTGIYGIIRVTSLLPKIEVWWGVALLVVGAVSAFVGILFSLGQRDIKRALAYSSVENIGIIGMALGVAVLGKALAMPVFTMLGFGAALFHILNHSLFKSLLFLNSGAIMHATGTRDIEALGGLLKKMPKTALLFFIGALAISGLPPLNGFAGEFVLYMGFFKTLTSPTAGAGYIAFAAAVLSIVGALAVAAFVRLFSTVFLGEGRTVAVKHAHEPGFGMLAPMFVLSFLCIVLGLFPSILAKTLDTVTRVWNGASGYVPSIANFAEFQYITYAGLLLIALLAVILVFVLIGSKRYISPGKHVTWDCGYAEPTSRMQYTGSSLAQILTALFAPLLRPRKAQIQIQNLFPGKEHFEHEVPDIVLDRSVLPLFHRLRHVLKKANVFQQGQTCQYILYIGIIVMVLFVVSMIGGW